MFSQLKATGELYHLTWVRNLAVLVTLISATVSVISGSVALTFHVRLQNRIAELRTPLQK
jgi:hypothetical protein